MPWLNDLWPLYTQTGFWLTIALTVVVWYLLSLAFAHLLVGSSNREPVTAANQGMTLSVVIMVVLLFCYAFFFFRASDWLYALAVSVTFLILAVLVSAVFTRLGGRD
ncbi:hypothetical protein [Deinococcus sp.]|uniref:hypothetical protein n=1 Tax=Deinococcus sp. TaxID=47478 RepID=UPI003C7E918C